MTETKPTYRGAAGRKPPAMSQAITLTGKLIPGLSSIELRVGVDGLISAVVLHGVTHTRDGAKAWVDSLPQFQATPLLIAECAFGGQARGQLVCRNLAYDGSAKPTQEQAEQWVFGPRPGEDAGDNQGPL